MDNNSLVISSTNITGAKGTRSITYINPNAPTTDMLNLSRGFVSLTTNTYNGATKVTKVELINKTTPTITVGSDGQTISAATLAENGYASVSFEGGNVETEAQLSTPYIKSNNTIYGTLLQWWSVPESSQDHGNSGSYMVIYYNADVVEDVQEEVYTPDKSTRLGTTGEIKVIFPENDIYNEVEITITITD